MGNVPQRCADIDAAFLNEVLDTDVRNGGSITGVDVQIIGEGVGFVGELARLTLHYGDGPPPAGAIRSLIAKVPTANPGFKHIGMQLGLYEKEHNFYRHVADRVSLSVPTVYLNHTDVDAHEFLLLMEDLAHLRPGNQLASCTLAEAEVVLREIAGFHATWWEHPDLAEFASWLPDNDSPYWLMLEHAYKASIPAVRPTFGYLLSEEVMALAERMAEVYPDVVRSGAVRRPHTFIHGDFRLDNMMFGQDLEFTLLDWQLPFKANPMWDVTYFLAGNFDPEFRRAHQDHLVRTYHDALVSAGVGDYSFEQCWEDYRANGLVLLGYIGTMASDVDMDSFNDRGREVIEMMVSRYALAVEDLRAAEFMP
jgi:hypothetical protein